MTDSTEDPTPDDPEPPRDGNEWMHRKVPAHRQAGWVRQAHETTALDGDPEADQTDMDRWMHDRATGRGPTHQ